MYSSMCGVLITVYSVSLITCKCVCVAGELSHNDKTLQRDGDTVEPMTSHYADVSRAWDIMDIMNNIEVWLVCEQGTEDVVIWEGGKNRRLEEIVWWGVDVIWIPY